MKTFVLGHVVDPGCCGWIASPVLLEVPWGLLPLGCLGKFSRRKPVGRICQRVENEPSQRVHKGQWERGRKSQRRKRLQSRHLENDFVLCDTVSQERQGWLEVRSVDAGPELPEQSPAQPLTSYLASLSLSICKRLTLAHCCEKLMNEWCKVFRTITVSAM